MASAVTTELKPRSLTSRGREISPSDTAQRVSMKRAA